MSSQIVDDEHIRVMVWAGLQPHPDGPLTWHVGRPGRGNVQRLGDDTAARTGAMLHAKNVASYEERYGEDEYDDEDDGDFVRPYVHASPQNVYWTPVDVFKAVEFYVYQSFSDEDHDEPDEEEALQFCGALSRRIGPSLAGWGTPTFSTDIRRTAAWESSPWGIEGASPTRRL